MPVVITNDFDITFQQLTGNRPFPWQSALYRRFVVGDFPPSCTLPTGLGKTAVVAIWLIAQAHAPERTPRRLVYVVNRRTVVDQTTAEAEKLRRNASAAGVLVPAISTLRGQFADNREWLADPTRPAVVIGTVDMIGSRLLFGGYGCGFKSRPLHAAFLGQDALLVHDEAHLEPAFQRLIVAIRDEQGREPSPLGERYRLRVMALTATPREGEETFELTSAERTPPADVPEEPAEPLHVVWQRLRAKKGIRTFPVESKRGAVAAKIGELATSDEIKASRRAVLVFVRTIEDVGVVTKAVERAKMPYRQLTGTLRGKERDELVGHPVFRRFLPDDPGEETEAVCLICTSAGEVGVDISADDLVCDLTPFDSMAQRLGRVNRRGGERRRAHVDVVHEADPDEKDEYDRRRALTLKLLRALPACDWDAGRLEASPAALGALRGRPDLPCRVEDAFSPAPTILPASDILFDAWALTSVCKQLSGADLPGRPPLAEYLHGIEDDKLAETFVAWREEVSLLHRAGLTNPDITDLLNDYPLKPHELLRDSTFRKNSGVRDQLAKAAERNGDLPVWVVDPRGDVSVTTLAELNELSLAGRTVILPPQAGCLAIDKGESLGLLDGAAPYQAAHHSCYDVADAPTDENGRQIRLRRQTVGLTEPPEGMRRVAAIRMRPESEDENSDLEPETKDSGTGGAPTHYQFFIRPRAADDDASKTARAPITWEHHTNDVVRNARRIADAVLNGQPALHTALVVAARFHDLGKRREVWQKSIGNPEPTVWYAKSGGTWKTRELTRYRHEFGSLLDVRSEKEFADLDPEVQDLVLHLIATHHGRGRPHFPADEAFDPGNNAERWQGEAREVPRRYARLQRKYGRWGLGYLESLLRAADAEASANPTALAGEEVGGG